MTTGRINQIAVGSETRARARARCRAAAAAAGRRDCCSLPAALRRGPLRRVRARGSARPGRPDASARRVGTLALGAASDGRVGTYGRSGERVGWVPGRRRRRRGERVAPGLTPFKPSCARARAGILHTFRTDGPTLVGGRTGPLCPPAFLPRARRRRSDGPALPACLPSRPRRRRSDGPALPACLP